MTKFVKTRLAAVPAFVLATAGAAHAAVPETVTEALTDMKADAVTVAGLVLVAAIAVYAFKFMRRGL